MNMLKSRFTGLVCWLVLGSSILPNAFGGQTKKWEQVPETVRATVLANGGKVGTVDLEREKINGLAVYEAVGKDKSGNEVDLVITEDGKLVATKNDDASDKAQEQSAKNSGKAAELPKFTHPQNITNPWLPLASVKQDILEGSEDKKVTRVERTARPDLHKNFKIGKQTVAALVFEDRVFEDGKLAEVALDYMAQGDDGAVYYLGEDVDEYKNGKIAGHEGAWLLGKHTKIPGILMPATPKVGDKFKAEDVPNITTEADEVMSEIETVTVPTGTYQNCLKIKEVLSDGAIEYKYFAKGIGCIKEVPADGELLLKSHTMK